jgi:Ni,Fe-hydrogenase III small subunit
MSQWVIRGLRKGVVTTSYPARKETAKGVSPGLPASSTRVTEEAGQSLATLCPTGAIRFEHGEAQVDYGRCVHCFRCSRSASFPLEWESGYEWARLATSGSNVIEGAEWPKAFQKSMHIRVVDAGDCGACLNEVKQLNNPYYNMHRLGFFITPTPRKADILLVVGPVNDHTRLPLQAAYEAMPTPKIVMAVGACALSGGVFGPSFVTGAGVKDVLPVDVEVPGSPPPPLAILHGLLVAAGRKQPAVSHNGR